MRKYRGKLKTSFCDHKGARILQTAKSENKVASGDAVELMMGFDRPTEAISAATLQSLRTRFAIACSSEFIEFIVGKSAYEAIRNINCDLTYVVDRPPSTSPSPFASCVAQSRAIRSHASQLSKKRLLRSLRRCSLKASLGQRRVCRQAQRKAAYSRSKKYLCNRRGFSAACRRGSRMLGARLNKVHRSLKLPDNVPAANSTNRTLRRLFLPER
ncbi:MULTISPECIES: iron-sulfur cluster assembly scaffold protein [Rhizobium]|uniref:iron-sulfur cluster assembly scaffold protein n=1 Tax=Rhizobium TaxID=379 RepID=UPI000EA8E39B|nr:MULTISPECIES: iron-sulfur cluster assembly scaffold protein [Rhizobium]AYG76896.1 nitrogen fixation protein NifU [Rhizobium sp. CCGE532]MBB6304997.1 NifU-like protein [Rhizobium leucaenae]MDK4743257.1 iron-sulfur cluster assembly scaffold protein [Rhizobium sp. CNPSo 3464]